MELNLNLNKDSIEKAVEKAIIESAIGDKIKDSVKTMIGRSYDNPIDDAIKKVVIDMAFRLVHKEFAAQVEAAVKEKMTSDCVEKIVAGFWEKLMRNY